MADPIDNTRHVTTASLYQIDGYDPNPYHDHSLVTGIDIETTDGDITEESAVTVAMVLPMFSNQWQTINHGTLGELLGDSTIAEITRVYGIDLIDYLRGSDRMEAEVLDTIGKMHDLRLRHGTPSDWYRRGAVDTLSQMPVSNRLGAIIEGAFAAALADSVLEWRVCEVAGTKNATAALSVILTDHRELTGTTPDIRSHQTVILGQILKNDQSDVALEGLLGTLRFDDDANVRHDAAFALWEAPDRRATLGLIAALDDDNEYVRTMATTALEYQGAAEAEDTLIAQLQDPALNARLSANEALQTCGGAAALSALTEPGQGMDDPAELVRIAALASYHQIALRLQQPLKAERE